MKFWEAVERIRKYGGKITRPIACGTASAEAWWDDRVLMDGAGRSFVVEARDLDADWQVVEPPPKEYSFMEAFAMMEQGKWMRPVTKMGWTQRVKDCHIEFKDDGGMADKNTGAGFLIREIKSKWIEAK